MFGINNYSEICPSLTVIPSLTEQDLAALTEEEMLEKAIAMSLSGKVKYLFNVILWTHLCSKSAKNEIAAILGMDSRTTSSAPLFRRQFGEPTIESKMT